MRLCYLNLWLVLCTTVLAHKLWQFVPWNSEINDCLPSDSTLCTLAISEICPEQKIFHGIRVSKCLISESLINKKRVHWSWKKTKKRKKERKNSAAINSSVGPVVFTFHALCVINEVLGSRFLNEIIWNVWKLNRIELAYMCVVLYIKQYY